jgi:hypothetical protein
VFIKISLVSRLFSHHRPGDADGPLIEALNGINAVGNSHGGYSASRGFETDVGDSVPRKERNALARRLLGMKNLALLLYAISLLLNGFVHVGKNAEVPLGYQMVILGLFAIKSFKPVWVWGSWLANFGFFWCLLRPSTEGDFKARRIISVMSLVLGLSFLAVSQYHASGSVGHNTQYYWAEIRPALGYFVWLGALACMTVHCHRD